MDDFKKELKKRCDSEFLKITAKHVSKTERRGTIKAMSESLKIYEKVLITTTDMVTKTVNELYQDSNIKKEEAIGASNEIIRGYLPKIKKTIWIVIPFRNEILLFPY
eukprot:GHVR01104675.1.p1 GENE.GHVR01104675.1~~GHVR01104675.1.p1  ORF type:complete len:107 (-),score=6.73 GHVR01104675.1:211-531(-)